jgi:hypothetical protein
MAATSATITGLSSTSANITTLTGSSATIAAVLVSNGIVFNKNSISATYTFPTDYNGLTVSPYTIAAGASVTLSAGSRWMVM